MKIKHVLVEKCFIFKLIRSKERIIMSQFSKNEQIQIPSIQIDKNVIKYGNSFICIDNISLITISPIPSNRT